MTSKQESQVFNDLGELKAEVKESRAETKRALNLITGNGRPEDGMLYIMHDVKKSLNALHDWIKSHDIVHTQINGCVQAHDKRLQVIETEKKVKDAEVKGGNEAISTIKSRIFKVLKNPVVLTAIAGLIAGLTGWNKDAIIKVVLTILGGG